MKKVIEKENSFEILRVISMFMVVIIHVANVYCRSFGNLSNSSFFIALVFNVISRMSVPVFFMISGSLLLDRKFNKEKYFKRILKYVILIISWELIYIVWEYLYQGIKPKAPDILFIEPMRAHLWFLYDILILYIIQPVLKKILDVTNKYIKVILLIIWFSICTSCIIWTSIAKYFGAVVYIGYFAIGKYLYVFIKKKDLKKYNILNVFIIIISLTISIILSYIYSLDLNRYYDVFFVYRAPFIILPSFALFTLFVTNYKKQNLSKYIVTLSDVSLGVYLSHGIFLDIFKCEFNYLKLHSSIGIPIFTIFISIFSIILVLILKKFKWTKKIV